MSNKQDYYRQKYGFIPQQPTKTDYYQKKYGFVPETPPQENKPIDNTDLLSRGLQFGRGVAKGTAGLADLANRFVAAPLANVAGGVTELAGGNPETFYQARDQWSQSHLGEQTAQGIDTLTGGRSEPRDALGRMLSDTGEFAVPLPIGKLAQAAGKMLPKMNMAENIAGAAGAAIALETTKDLLHDHPVADFAKVIIGDIAGRKSLSLGQMKSLKAIQDSAAHLMAKPFAIGAKPDLELIRLAKQEGIELPANIKLNSPAANFASNVLFKSIFASKAWKNVLKNADNDMIKQFTNTMDSVSSQLHSPAEASHLYREELKPIAKDLKDQSKKLFKHEKQLTEQDKVLPTNTMQAIAKAEQDLTADVPSADMEFVTGRLNKLKEIWLPENKELNELIQAYPAMADQIREKFPQTLPEQTVKKLIDQKKAFNRSIKYGENAAGYRKFLGPVIDAIEKDIETLQNPKFQEKRQLAKAFYKTEIVERIETDLARSLLQGQFPKEAYTSMGTVEGIQQLEHIIGTTPKAKQVMAIMKRAKLEELLGPIIKDDTLSYAKLASQPQVYKQQDLFKELMGPEAYQKFTRLGKIAQGFVAAGKDLANPSGSAIAGKDIIIMSGLFAIKRLAGSLSYAGGINLASRLMSDPKLIDRAIQLTKAEKANHPQKVAHLMKQLVNALQYTQHEEQPAVQP